MVARWHTVGAAHPRPPRHPTRTPQDSCDLLICDEAHRLKNDATLTNRALAGLACKRRVLLSGTPMQNDLQEFFAMVDFTNTGILGDAGACACGALVARPCGRTRAATSLPTP